MLEYGLVAIVIIVALLLVVAGLALFIASRARQTKDADQNLKKMVPDAKLGEYERPSSLAAEQVEEMVTKKLAAYPDLADAILDFGTMPDGSLDIRINRAQYNDIEDIPDERIRQAIKEAVDEYNRQA